MNGKKTRFWSDPWLYEKPLYTVVPVVFILCEQKEASVANVKNGKIQITFRRWLTDELQTCWDKINSDVNTFQLQENEDVIIWRLEKTTVFL